MITIPPQKYFDTFASKVIDLAKKTPHKKAKLPPKSTNIDVLREMAKPVFEEGFIQNFGSQFIDRILNLGSRLVGLGHSNYASILYGLTLKSEHLKESNPKILNIAENALAIARADQDPVHVAARAHDLELLLKKIDPRSEDIIKALQEEKQALNLICKNYKYAQKQYRSNGKEIKPIENYQAALVCTKYDIAKILIHSNIGQAEAELKSANDIVLAMIKELKKEI